jgi:hypothetical protein
MVVCVVVNVSDNSCTPSHYSMSHYFVAYYTYTALLQAHFNTKYLVL